MPSRRLRFIVASLALIASPLCCADAATADNLAARAVTEAKSMGPGRARDVALREVSRNLRYADRDQAIEAAAAMSEDYELRTFSPAPDKLNRRIRAQPNEQDSADRTCTRFVERLKPGTANMADDRRIRDCFSMDAPPGIVPPPIPPYRLLLLAADALPSGKTKAELLYMATWVSVPDRPAGGAVEAVRRLRALVPLLSGNIRQEASGWLETTEVDLIEGRPDDAIARVRRSLADETSSPDDLLGESATQARGLISNFLSTRDINRALTVTNLLPPSADCAMIDDGLTGVFQWVLPLQDGAAVAAYMARLQATGSLARLCPRGLDDEIASDVWLKAGNEAKALQAAIGTGKPLVIARVRLSVVDSRLSVGNTEGARAMAREATADLASLNVGDPSERVAAARGRVQLIHQLVQLGEMEQAERLAASFPGPGWRGFAYSAIVATTNRDRAGPDWAGPFLDLTEVPADQ